LEDQSVATAVARLLAASDAQDFSDCSPGFRPGRSPQQARHAVRQGLLGSRRGSGIACDLSAFFDTGQPNTLWAMRRPRINAGRRLERIEKWRHAGILDGKERVYPEKGSPQGSVISPLRANGYLPEVLDTWGETVVQAHCRGPVALSRYADDGAPRTHERRLNHDRMR
jgi:retron-type reverse transcriptase